MIVSVRLLSSRFWLAALVGCLFVLQSCGDKSLTVLDDPSRGADALADTDLDGVPDGIERGLGTDPDEIDSDGDGLTDHYELWPTLPLGAVGALTGLPDIDTDSRIAPLDRDEAGATLLRGASAVETERMRVIDPADETVPNDADGDGVPSDYELHGFTYEIDQVTGEDWFSKWDGDISRSYFKTDPTQWSTDGDPWSDWEEATKRHMDQRVKHPGDHPCIPAYPEIYAAITGYQIDLNQDVEIESASGTSAERSWSNTALVSGWEKDVSNMLEVGGEFDAHFSTETGGVIAGVAPGTIIMNDGGHKEKVSLKYHHKEADVSYGSNNYTNDLSGMSAKEWSTARAVSGDSLFAARLILNIHLVNVGTMVATHPRLTFNVKIGDAINTVVFLEYPGELEAHALGGVDLVIAKDGYSSNDDPAGMPLMLSVNALRNIQNGAPISLVPVHFEADTLVAVADPDTGHRQFIGVGQWSPYEAAIENVSAHIAMDFNEDPTLGQPLYNNMPAKKIQDVRVFAYNNRGSYIGSPPKITLFDAFNWAYGVKEDEGNFIVTIRDPISGLKHQSYMLDWSISVERNVFDEVLNESPQYLSNLFTLPLKPGNPIKHTYIAKAPPSGLRAKPRIYWATVNAKERLVRAFCRDVSGTIEVRFKPDDSYVGEQMFLRVLPNDPLKSFAWTYAIPKQYRWTGKEKVIATNGLGKQNELPIEFESLELGELVAEDVRVLSWAPSGGAAEEATVGFNLEGPDLTAMPFDVELRQYREGGVLKGELTPRTGAGVYDIGVVADLDQISYNYLRKRPFIDDTDLPLTLGAPLFPLAPDTPLYNHIYAVRTRNNKLAVFAPQMKLLNGEYYVQAVTWRLFEGI